MAGELLSTARPSRLRLLGFLAIGVGALLVGVGSVREWVQVGLKSDVRGAIDVPVNGTDEWQGKALIIGAVIALALMLVMRLATSAATRRVLAAAVMAIGIAAAATGLLFVAGVEDRYARTDGIDVLAQEIARETGDAVDVVKDALLVALRGELRVDVGAAIWLVVAGGIVLAIGGALSLAWVRERERARSSPDAEPAPVSGA